MERREHQFPKQTNKILSTVKKMYRVGNTAGQTHFLGSSVLPLQGLGFGTHSLERIPLGRAGGDMGLSLGNGGFRIGLGCKLLSTQRRT